MQQDIQRRPMASFVDLPCDCWESVLECLAECHVALEADSICFRSSCSAAFGESRPVPSLCCLNHYHSRLVSVHIAATQVAATIYSTQNQGFVFEEGLMVSAAFALFLELLVVVSNGNRDV